MRLILLMLICLFTLPTVTSADVPDAEVKKKAPKAAEEAEAKRILGTWKVVAIQSGGRKVPAEVLREMRLVFDAKLLFMGRKGGEGMRVNYVIKPAQSKPTQSKPTQSKPTQPGHIDTSHKLGSKVFTQLGIYTLEKDRLKICFAPAGSERPKKFETPTGAVFVLERAEVKKGEPKK